MGRIAGVSAVVLGLTLGAGGIAGAFTSDSSSAPAASTAAGFLSVGATRPSAAGTVKSVGTDTFTLTKRDGTVVTVNVTSATTYVERGVTSPTLANVTVGSRVAVVGTDTANTVAATKVRIGAPGSHRHGNRLGGVVAAAAGTVKSVGTNTFTLTKRDGTVVTVNVTGATTYVERGVTSPNLANVTVGSRVAVVGTDTANTVAATKVFIGAPGGHRHGNRLGGTRDSDGTGATGGATGGPTTTA